ncbi:histone-lysine N-methyltransferase SETMAR [Plakobranchus ocellatus]|uniref:Histone-lysine N-methyltransferase SETMAR n=1 Tax=Plakobranchus ocellatus TaxID=259542 RepID=A0AAV3ZUB3_9GAST|nr:histone-lysine N-methyltransferase SETMAR [Plakobranchus ocellatus]
MTHIGVGPGGDFQANNNLFDNLITGDETWVHLNTPETKRDSMTWKHPSSPVTKKFKVQRSAAKVMATVFWDAKGVILLDILPQGQCINAARYCSTPYIHALLIIATKQDSAEKTSLLL